MQALLLSLRLFIQRGEDAPATDSSGQVPIGFVLALIVTGLIVFYFVQKRRRFARYMASLGFTKAETPPPSLHPSPNAWTSSVVTRRVFTGVHKGFPAAFLEVQIGVGEGAVWRSALAVQRAPFRLPLPSPTENARGTFDATSTPGWLIVSLAGAGAEPSTLAPILRELTQPAPIDQPEV